MNSHWSFRLLPSFAIVLATLVCGAPAIGATLYVTNDGADSGSCGSAAKPCRSISQNNFFGNDRNRPALNFESGSAGPGAHCGVLTVPSVFYPGSPPQEPMPGTSIRAGDNFWGAASGPSPSDPGMPQEEPATKWAA
jgi:hypothetical protein